MAGKSTRPKPFGVGSLRVRAIRGPRPDGSWYWRAERNEDGKHQTLWTGWGTRRDAERAVAALVATADARPTRPGPKDEGHEVQTVRDLLETWLYDYTNRRDLADDTKRLAFRSARHGARLLGEVHLGRLEVVDLERFRDLRLREGAATGTILTEIAILRRAWNWGRSRHYCPDRKLGQPRIKHKAVGNKYTPTPAEFWRVVDQLEGWARTTLVLLGSTGCRIGEVARIRWSDLRRDRLEVTVSGKTGARVVNVNGALFDALDELEGPRTGRVLPVGVETVRKAFGQRQLPKACEDAGVPTFTPNALRRMVIRQFYDSGADVGTVASQLGQSPVVALKYYHQATPARRQRIVQVAGIGRRERSNVLPLRPTAEDAGKRTG